MEPKAQLRKKIKAHCSIQMTVATKEMV